MKTTNKNYNKSIIQQIISTQMEHKTLLPNSLSKKILSNSSSKKLIFSNILSPKHQSSIPIKKVEFQKTNNFQKTNSLEKQQLKEIISNLPQKEFPPIKMSVSLINKSQKKMSQSSSNWFDMTKLRISKIEFIYQTDKKIVISIDNPDIKSVRWLKNKIIEELAFYTKGKNNEIDNDFISFKTLDNLHIIDYIFTIDSHLLDFLPDFLSIEPIYKSGIKY